MIFKGEPKPECLQLTREQLPGAQQASAVDELSLINRVLFTMCIGAVVAGLETSEEGKRLGKGRVKVPYSVLRHRPANACQETVPIQLPASQKKDIY